jgi:acyl carrier protein
MNSKDEILAEIKKILINEFELEEDKIVPSAKLYEELDLDSIDAIDMVIKMQEITGKKVKPEEFKSVRTIEDLVETIHTLINAS